MMRKALFFGLILFFKTIMAQTSAVKDTLYLQDGFKVGTSIIDTTLGLITIPDSIHKSGRQQFDVDDVFSIRYKDGKTVFYYTQDLKVHNDFTRDEMIYYMQGERDARHGFKARGSFIGSTLTGFTASFLTGSPVAPVPPLIYLSMSGLPRVKINHKSVTNTSYLDFDSYLLGYEHIARGKRRVECIKGSLVGLVTGFAANFFINMNNH